MGQIYVEQTKLRMIVETEADLTGATVFEIKYKKPDETEDKFTAVCDEEAKGVIYYDFGSGDLDQTGDWIFWAFITFGSDEIPGESFEIHVYNEGE